VGFCLVDITSQIEAALDELRPGLRMDGGDVEFVEFKDGDVYVRLKGQCLGCPISALTLKAGLELNLRRTIPEVNSVIAV